MVDKKGPSSELFDEAKAALEDLTASEFARNAQRRPSLVGQLLGALGLLVGTIVGVAAILGLSGPDPGSAAIQIAISLIGLALFARAFVAQRRWRVVKDATVNAREASHWGAFGTYVLSGGADDPTTRMISQFVRRFLDDPIRHQFVSFDGPDGVYIRFTLASNAPRTLVGVAASDASLGRSALGQDGPRGLIALGWATPAPGIRKDFAAEWRLPVVVDELAKVVVSTAKIYGVEASNLMPATAIIKGSPQTIRVGGDGASEDAKLGPLERSLELLRGPIGWAVVVLIVVIGKDRLDAGWRTLPPIAQTGLGVALTLYISAICLRRYRQTADPIRSVGYDRLRGRTVVTYAPHAWWGIIGVGAALAAALLLVVGFAGGFD
jgi:hypothetical protein